MRIKEVNMPSDSEIGELRDSITRAVSEAINGKRNDLVMSVLSAFMIRISVEVCEGNIHQAQTCLIRSMNKSFDIYKDVLVFQKKEPEAGC